MVKVATILLVVLTGCSSLPLGMLGGSGTNVAANTQVGKENRQSVFAFDDRTEVGRDNISKEVEAGEIDNLNITNESVPPWVILLLLLGWLLPTPSEIARWVYKLFGKTT
jgi:hypothetical protein